MHKSFNHADTGSSCVPVVENIAAELERACQSSFLPGALVDLVCGKHEMQCLLH